MTRRKPFWCRLGFHVHPWYDGVCKPPIRRCGRCNEAGS